MQFPIPLRRYILLQLGLVTVVLVAVVVALVWLILLPQMRTEISIRHLALARSIAGQVAAHLMGGERQLGALADYIETQENVPESGWSELLDAQCGKGDFFETIYIVNNQNERVSSVGLASTRRNRRDDLLGLDLSSRDFLHTARKLGKNAWSETFLSTASSRLAVALTIPSPQHAMIGEITVDQLSKFVSHLPVESGLITMILDRRGRIVADSQRIFGGRQFSLKNLPAIDNADDGTVASGEFELDGRLLIGTVVMIDQLGWKVLVAQPQGNAFRQIKTTYLTITIGLMIALALALVIGRFQASKLTDIFRQYGEQAQSIAQGHYDLQWPESRTTEFEHLADNLQRMAEMISRREHELVASERNLKITLDSIGDAVIATDTKGLITRMNPTAEKLTGWSAAEALGRPLSTVFHIVNSNTRQKVANPVEKVIAEAKIVGLADHTLLIARDGSEYQIADSGAPIRRDDGSIIGVVLVFRDVTDAYVQAEKMRENEELLKNITTNVPGAVYQVLVTPDYEYHLRFMSEKATEIFGLDVSLDDFFSKFSAGIPIDEKDRFIASIQESVDKVRPWYYEGRFSKPSGDTIWFSGSAIPHLEGDNVVSNGVFMDITERKRIEEELMQHRERLEELVKERTRELETAQEKLVKREKLAVLGQLTATVSHELRNPLGVVRSSTFYLQRKLSDAEKKIIKHLVRIDEQVGICDTIVGDLLEFTRGRHSERSRNEINPFLHQIIKDFSGFQETKVVLKLAENVPPIHFDREKMRRAVVNLFTNAVQAVTAKKEESDKEDIGYEPLLSISTRLVEDGVIIQFEDNGIGMDEATRKRAFEPLFTTKAKGTGLGLAIVEKIILEHEGTVSLESDPEKGTRVKVLLPIAKSDGGV